MNLNIVHVGPEPHQKLYIQACLLMLGSLARMDIDIIHFGFELHRASPQVGLTIFVWHRELLWASDQYRHITCQC